MGAELRHARTNRGLSGRQVGASIGISSAEVSRIERGLAPRVPFLTIARLASTVGLELSARLFPGGPPLRDFAHVRLLADLHALLDPSLRWATEVPLPAPGDQRAWDALISGRDWRLGVEAETAPRDAQALSRRIQLKLRDGGVDGVILALRDTRVVREFLDGAGDELLSLFPVGSRGAFAALRAGNRPSGNALVVVPRSGRSKG
jgi:transcriptional regulator with XRE-family HTH domain